MPATTTPKLDDHFKNRKSFIAEARAAEQEVERTGLVYRGADVHRFILAINVKLLRQDRLHFSLAAAKRYNDNVSRRKG